MRYISVLFLGIATATGCMAMYPSGRQEQEQEQEQEDKQQEDKQQQQKQKMEWKQKQQQEQQKQKQQKQQKMEWRQQQQMEWKQQTMEWRQQQQMEWKQQQMEWKQQQSVQVYGPNWQIIPPSVQRGMWKGQRQSFLNTPIPNRKQNQSWEQWIQRNEHRPEEKPIPEENKAPEKQARKYEQLDKRNWKIFTRRQKHAEQVKENFAELSTLLTLEVQEKEAVIWILKFQTPDTVNDLCRHMKNWSNDAIQAKAPDTIVPLSRALKRAANYKPIDITNILVEFYRKLMAHETQARHPQS